MNAPPRGLCRTEFNGFIGRHCWERYTKSTGGRVCKKCGSRILQVAGFASVHAVEFGDHCAGDGDVKRFPLPYCPNCEGKPTETSTCIHVPMFPSAGPPRTYLQELHEVNTGILGLLEKVKLILAEVRARRR